MHQVRSEDWARTWAVHGAAFGARDFPAVALEDVGEAGSLRGAQRSSLSQMRVNQPKRSAGIFSSNWWAVLGSNQ